MKKLFIAFALFPLIALAQNKKEITITGNVTGFPDGTNISFFNPQTQILDSVAAINNNGFSIKMEPLDEPDFKFLVFNKQQPVTVLMIDNSDISISGSRDDLGNLNVTGSQTYSEYKEFTSSLKQFEEIFQTENFTPENVAKIGGVCEDFVKSHPRSYVSLLAISEIVNLAANIEKAEQLMALLDQNLLETELGGYLANRISVEKHTSIGSTIMSFTQNDLDGKPVKISDFRGQYVLIDFWASWCRPCRIENPNVVANYNRFKDKKFTVLGVSLDQSKDAWAKAIEADKLTWTHVSDLKGWANAVSSKFNITSIPTNILIDPNGVIIAKNVRGAELGATLERILGK